MNHMIAHKKPVFMALLLAVLLVTVAGVPVRDASAATCTPYPRFTSRYNGKPTLYIWGIPNSGTNSTGIGIYYKNASGRWEQVPASSAWGIQMIPQVRSSEWTGYYIATRWLIDYEHWGWDDDWRWYVEICR